MFARVRARVSLLALAVSPVLAAPLHAQPSAPPAYDLILRGGTVIDGTGAPRLRADVAITRGHIVAIGDLAGASAAEELDVRGLFVAPGFINIHSHAMPAVLPTAANMLTQGVTTELLNADGNGPPDLASQLARYAASGLAVNIAASAGFNSVWAAVMGQSDKRPSAADTERMRAMLRDNLEQGAFGISAGLDYKPAYFANTAEATAVLSVARGWRTFFPNHDRLTPETGFSSRRGMEETMAIANGAGMVPVFTHMKVQGHEQGSAAQILQRMTDEAKAGRWVAADVYPYLAGQTGLAALIIPGWAQDGGLAKMRERFADSAMRRRIVTEADEAIRARLGSAASILLNESGRRLPEIMADMGVTSAGEAVVRILETSTPSAIMTFGAEDDLRRILAHPAVAIACDCGAWNMPRAHPRGYGTFPRILGHYVRETRLLTWEQAVHKMTALPAAIMGLTDRGLLAPGMAADIAVFDSATVIDRATYEQSDLPSEGIRFVLVNGVLALRDGVVTGAQGGITLRRSRHMPSRPATADSARAMRARGSVQAVDGTVTANVVVDVTQAADARGATGSVRLRLPSGAEWVGGTLGTVQSAPHWASVTGTFDTPEGVRAFTLLVDAGSTEVRDGSAHLALQVDGLPLLTGIVQRRGDEDRTRVVARLDSIAAAVIERGESAGMAVAVVRGRDTLLFKGYGQSDIENRVPVTAGTVFRIGSVTKQFTSAAIMQLVEHGTVGLDDVSTKYLPRFPTHGRRVLVRHLLNHTSGIPSYTDIGARFGRVARLDLAPDSLLAIVAGDSLLFEPGTHFYYNNTGYFMLGQVIERVTGMRYARFLEDSLLARAGLSHTLYCDTRRIIPNRAQGYDRTAQGFVNTDFLSMDLPNAAGSLCSTVGDLVSWTQQLHGGRVVNAASLRQMTTPVTLPSGRPMRYGYALTVDTVGGHPLVGHGGGINGFSAYLTYAPNDSLVVAVLTNTAGAPSSRVADALVRAALGVPTASEVVVQDLPLTSAERARYVGEYAVTQPDGSRRRMRVLDEEGQLVLEPQPGMRQRLRAQGEHTFVLPTGMRVVFDVRGETATGLQFGAGSSRALEGVRVSSPAP